MSAATPFAIDIGAGGADPLAELLNAQRPADPQPAANLSDLIDRQTGKSALIDFDPAMHETDNAGNPIKNLNGTFRLKRGRGSPRHRSKSAAGGVSDLAGAGSDGGDVEQPAPPPAPPYGPDEARRDALLAVGTITGSLQGFFGPQWKPDAEEFDLMRDELAAFCLSRGGLGIPPWLGIAMAFGMYAGRRVELPGGLNSKVRGLIGGGESDPGEVDREYPPSGTPEARPAVDARPRPTTQGTQAAAGSRPPMRRAA